MPTIVTEKSINLLEKLFREEMSHLKNWWQQDDRDLLISTAKSIGMPTQFIEELKLFNNE